MSGMKTSDRIAVMVSVAVILNDIAKTAGPRRKFFILFAEGD